MTIFDIVNAEILRASEISDQRVLEVKQKKELDLAELAKEIDERLRRVKKGPYVKRVRKIPEGMVSTKDGAEIIGMDRISLNSLLKEERIPGVKVHNRRYVSERLCRLIKQERDFMAPKVPGAGFYDRIINDLFHQ